MKTFNKKLILTTFVAFTLSLTGPISVFAATATMVDLGSILTNNFVSWSVQIKKAIKPTS